jgi:molybdopterin converting factor small subunit
MKITARFFGPFHSLAGVQTMTLALDEGASLNDLFPILQNQLPEAFAEKVIAPIKNDRKSIGILLVNMAHIQNPDELGRSLADGDIVTFVPPMNGG